jgi:quinol-cytochrome oxidoreductase complex cytochrome b subunit
VGTEIVGAIPLIGKIAKYLLRGGETVGAETLSRFYVAHVIVFPWMIVGLVSLHLFLMRLQGLAPLEPVGKETPLTEQNSIPFYPDHVLTELVVFPFFFLVLIGLCILFPVGLGEKANPFLTPEGIKPEWYFLPIYQLLKYFPKLLGILAAIIPILILLSWPFLDRKNPERRPGKRPLSLLLGAAAITAMVGLGILGYLSERDFKIGAKTYHLDLDGAPHRVEKSESATPPAGEPQPGKSGPP